MLNEILKYLPIELSREIQSINTSDKVKEIRIRSGRPVCIKMHNTEIFTKYIASINDLLNILINISKNSIYAIQNDINNGYVVIPGGHRVGICGEAVISDGRIKNIKNINSMNIRVANEIIGSANKILPYIVKNSSEIRNTLIVSPPGCGKTTILRDLIRQLSSGIKELNFGGKNVGVIDERGEIAAIYQGKTKLDLGIRTDIISNCSKNVGIEMLIRSMGLDIIATDEIGLDSDIDAIKKASLSGVSMIFTMHGENIFDICKRSEIRTLLEEGLFSCIVVLSNKNGVGTIEDIKIINNKEDLNDCG